MVQTRVDHMTFVVKDPEKTKSFFENVLCCKRLLSLNIGGGIAHTFNIGDKLPVLGFASAPAEGEGMFPDFVRKKGSGLHHMGFQVDNLDNFKKIMIDHGIKIPEWELEGDEAVRNEVLIGPVYASTVLQVIQYKQELTKLEEWAQTQKNYHKGNMLEEHWKEVRL